MARLAPVGAVLAGGRGRRFGAPEKGAARLLGRPLISYPLAALREALDEAPVVVAKPGTRLGALLDADVELWLEAPQPFHPAVGIATALRRAAGRPVLVCAVDMPLLDAAELALIAREHDGQAAVLARAAGRLQPLCALYGPGARDALADGGASGVALTRIAEGLDPLVLERPDARPYLNVNTPSDLALAEAALRRRLEQGSG